MAAKEGACEAGESVVVSPSLLTVPVDGWDLPGFSLGVDDWFACRERASQEEKVSLLVSSAFVAIAGFYKSICKAG